MTTILGIIALTAPVDATYPGLNGRIAFARRLGDESPDIFVANADGSALQQVLLDQPAETWAIPVWSPDASEILISNLDRGEGVDPEFVPAIVEPDGSNFRAVEATDAPADVTYCSEWTPDSTRLLCGLDPESGALPGVISIRTDGGGFTRITTNPYGSLDVPTDVSPAGDRFVFLRYRPGSQPSVRPFVTEQVALFRANMDGSGVRQLTRYGLAEPHEIASAQWSPDGRQIISETREGMLFVVRPDGSGLRTINLATGTPLYFAFEPHWSPDGTRIVFCMFLNGQEDLYTANADGSDVQQLTDTPGFENGPDWGPAGP